MEKFYVQRTWTPIPGLEKHAGTDKIEFKFPQGQTRDRKATYMRAVCNIRPQKTDTHQTRITAVGNLIYYPREFRTPTSDLTTMELHVNSAISDVKSRYICMDVKYFYLNNKMDSLTEKSHNGYIYARVTKGMYGILQADRISHAARVEHPDPYGYHPSSKKNPDYGNTTVNQ